LALNDPLSDADVNNSGYNLPLLTLLPARFEFGFDEEFDSKPSLP
jgi:hypothetical protein